MCLPENHKLIYHLCLQLSFAHVWLSFFSYNTCSRNICGVCLGLWFVSKKIKSRLYLFNLLGNINFCKIQVGRKTIFFLSTWLFEIFLCNLSLTFLPILQNPSCLGMFWKFPCPSQVGYHNISMIKQTTSKVTAEDGSVPLVLGFRHSRYQKLSF